MPCVVLKRRIEPQILNKGSIVFCCHECGAESMWHLARRLLNLRSTLLRLFLKGSFDDWRDSQDACHLRMGPVGR